MAARLGRSISGRPLPVPPASGRPVPGRLLAAALALGVTVAAWLAIAGATAPGAAEPAPTPSETPGAAEPAPNPFDSVEALGEAFFFDPGLSANRTQACATCHDPGLAFVDPRETQAGRSVSMGDDGASLGDRNTPTATYARFSPPFHRDEAGEYVGGQFLDGREHDLIGQAMGPPLNPIEMGMPDEAAVVGRLAENPDYVAALKGFFGPASLESPERAYRAMAEAIARYEHTPVFSPFDSRYDRFLRGEAELTDQEELGRVLFFSQQFSNCNLCHQLRASQRGAEETFSNYQFHNIGVPPNPAVRKANGSAVDRVDHGLLEHPEVSDPAQDGKFKVPTLRNVAVTGPYMHNGVFEDLRTAVLFYNKYNSKNPKRQINPETGKDWGQPEVPGTLSTEKLTHGPALDDKRIDALVAFLKTLTDQRYEHLLAE